MGGSTLINGMICVRGQPADYDGWEAAGAAGWNWVQAERLFPRSKPMKGGAGRGHDGPMRLHEVSERYPVAEAFLKAAQQDGQPLNPDYNAGSQEGVGYQVLQHRGRLGVVDGYLKPASGRPNPTVECGARITRLLFEGRRCVGLAYRGRDGEHMVRARRETLLCLGAVQSPQLLELSGVGDPALLARLGIPLAHALPQVGEEHRPLRHAHELAREEHGDAERDVARLAAGAPGGALRAVAPGHPDAGHGAGARFRQERAAARAARRAVLLRARELCQRGRAHPDRFPGMTIGVAQLRPESVGSIHAVSADPLAAPAIRPNFLAARIDRDSLVGGMRAAHRLAAGPAALVAAELSPGKDVQSDDEWLDFARQNGQTIYHPIGTCRMGADADAVTDSRLRVNGLDGLRVVDASVMPRMVSGNTQAAVMMVAERGAELILEDAARAG